MCTMRYYSYDAVIDAGSGSFIASIFQRQGAGGNRFTYNFYMVPV